MNKQAEALLLSGFIKYPGEFFEYTQHLASEDFSDAINRATFECIQSLILEKESKTITKSKLMSEAKSLGHSSYAKHSEEVDKIISETVNQRELGQFFLEVKRQSLIRAYKGKIREVVDYLDNTSDNLSSVISNVENSVISAVSAVDCGETSIKHLSKDLKKFTHGLADDPGYFGLDIGFKLWQSRIGQIRNASVTFVAATAKAGKSQYGLRSAITTAHKLNLPVLYIDTELSEQDQKVRMVGMIADVPYPIIETGFWKLPDDELRKRNVPEDEIIKIQEYRKRMNDDVFWQMAEALQVDYLSVSGKGLDDVIPHMRRWVLTKVKTSQSDKYPRCLIIYDYLKLASINNLQGGRVAEWQLHGLNYGMLHDFAKRYNLPILAFGQTNNNDTSDEACIAGAKRIVENVTSASIFRPKTEEEFAMDNNGSHIIKIFVTRHGSGTRNSYINVEADLSRGHFREIGIGTVNFAEERQRRIDERRNRRNEADDD